MTRILRTPEARQRANAVHQTIPLSELRVGDWMAHDGYGYFKQVVLLKEYETEWGERRLLVSRAWGGDIEYSLEASPTTYVTIKRRGG